MRSTTFTTRTFSVGQVLAQQVDGGERLERGDVAGAGQHDVGLAAGVARRPRPRCRCPRVQCSTASSIVSQLRRRLLAGDDDVHVVAAAQAVVGDRQQRVGVGRQVHPDHLGLLVHDVVDEARVLMREAVVVLAPDVAA